MSLVSIVSSVKSIKPCYVNVERRNSIEKSGNARLYGGADSRCGRFLGVGATARTMSHCVKASSSLMRKAALVWPDAAHRSPDSDRDGCLSSPVRASLMDGLHCQEKKGEKSGPGSPQRINTYARENLPGMLKTPIKLRSLLTAPSAVSCITSRQTSGSERVENIEHKT